MAPILPHRKCLLLRQNYLPQRIYIILNQKKKNSFFFFYLTCLFVTSYRYFEAKIQYNISVFNQHEREKTKTRSDYNIIINKEAQFRTPFLIQKYMITTDEKAPFLTPSDIPCYSSSFPSFATSFLIKSTLPFLLF